jgi:DNA-binding response OmpR family regulator
MKNYCMSSSNNKKSSNNNSRILLVDDEKDACLVYKMVLEHNGFEVDSFEDPVLALSNFKPDFYDLVVLDIRMPGMNGFKLYLEMRKTDNKVKICFLTASEMYHEDYREEEAGEIAALDKALFILKPISNEDLVHQINKIMMMSY